MPALAWANGLQKRAARVGFDYASPKGAAESVAEEARELATAEDPKRQFEEMGDLLFAIVSLARSLKVNPEDALRVAGQRRRSIQILDGLGDRHLGEQHVHGEDCRDVVDAVVRSAGEGDGRPPPSPPAPPLEVLEPELDWENCGERI